MSVFYDWTFSLHTCVGLLWKNVAYFPFKLNSWLSFQRLCRLLWGYLFTLNMYDMTMRMFLWSVKRQRDVDGRWQRAAGVVDGAVQLSTDAQWKHSSAHLANHSHQLRLQLQDRSDWSDQRELLKARCRKRVCIYRLAQNKPDYLLLLSKLCISTTKHVTTITYV